MCIYACMYVCSYRIVFIYICLVVCLCNCLFIYLSVYLSIHLFLYMSESLSIYLVSIYVCLSIFLSTCPYIYRFIHLSMHLYISECLPTDLFHIYIFVWRSIYLPISYLSAYFSISATTFHKAETFEKRYRPSTHTHTRSNGDIRGNKECNGSVSSPAAAVARQRPPSQDPFSGPPFIPVQPPPPPPHRVSPILPPWRSILCLHSLSPAQVLCVFLVTVARVSSIFWL